MVRGDKLHIIATGSQAPYGIGETIAIFPAGHRRKIQAELDRWYSKPDVDCYRQGEHLLTIKGSDFRVSLPTLDFINSFSGWLD